VAALAVVMGGCAWAPFKRLSAGAEALERADRLTREGAAIGELAEGGEIGELVACCDIDEFRARRCARDFGIPLVFTDHRELLERAEVDCVFVAMHPRLQPELATDCLRAGKHVFIEKPRISTSAASSRRSPTRRGAT
jgi:predicted dehydrogenase